MEKLIDTYHAPAKRKDLQKIREIAQNLLRSHFEEILNTIPDIALILTKERQAVFLNESLINMLGIKDPDRIFGARPGEIFNCIHANDHINGCGTSRDCKFCGVGELNPMLIEEVIEMMESALCKLSK